MITRIYHDYNVTYVNKTGTRWNRRMESVNGGLECLGMGEKAEFDFGIYSYILYIVGVDIFDP